MNLTRPVCFVLAATLLASGAVFSVSAAEVKPLAPDDLRQALALAMLAAKNKLPELSLRAVRGALAAGPPIQPLTLPFGQAGSTSSRNQNQQSYQLQVNEIEAAVAELSAEWERQQFDPAAVYETLSAVVFPESRPAEMFLYSRTSDDNTRAVRSGVTSASTSSSGSIGGLLVDWAIRADRTQSLVQRIEQRGASPRAKFDAWVLVADIALKQNDLKTLARQLAESQQLLKAAGALGTGDAAARIALAALKYAELREPALAVLESSSAARIALAGSAEAALEPMQSWRKTAALTRLQMGDLEGARRNFQEMLRASDAYYTRYSGDYPARMRRQLLESIAKELLNHHQLVDAFQLLAEHSDLQFLDASTVSIPSASLARQLGRLAPKDRYEFLTRWTFPAQPGSALRMMTGFLPALKPPVEFVAALDAPLRAHGFGFAPSTPHPMVFHSGAALVVAAAECGKLAELESKLKPHLDGKSLNADVLDRLLQLRAPDATALLTDFEARAAYNESAKTVPLDTFVLGLFAVERPELRDVGERMILTALGHAKRLQQALPRSYMWMAHAELLRKIGGDDVPRTDGLAAEWPAFRDWRPIGFAPADALSAGAAPNWFCSFSDVARAVSAEPEAALMYRYPLVGDFDVSVSISEGDWSEGGLLFGGQLALSYRHSNSLSMSVIGRGGNRAASASLLRDAAVDNDLRFEVRQGILTWFVNGHRVLQEDCGTASPFVGLRTSVGYTPTFRQFRISGEPQIPREVVLLQDERLLGWNPTFYRETAPSPVRSNATAAPPTDAAPHWSLNQGVLEGQRRRGDLAAPGDATTADSLLYYQRPLWDGEWIRYEFYCDPGKVMVHPALDRLAFVVQPDAVRLHWLTEGAADWTGLSSTNVAEDPVGQLAAGRLPLKERAWNTMVVAVDDGRMTLTLNDVPIYRRTLPPDASRRFGFYHHRDREAVQVRDAVLSGDWPKALPADLAVTPFAPAAPLSPGSALQAARHVKEESVTKDALAVVRKARALPAAERYDLLRQWVLPVSGDTRIRLRGEFLPPHDPLVTGPEPHVVAPALELIGAAMELRQMKELRELVAAVSVAPKTYDQRAQLALVTLIDMAQGRVADVIAELKELSSLLPEVKTTVEWERWPEVLVASRAMLYFETREPALLMLDWIVEQQLQKGQSTGWRFDQRVRCLRGSAQGLAMTGGPLEQLGTTASADWIPVTHAKADIRALGIPEARWLRTPAGIRKLYGHEDDFLYFRTPLVGDFEVTAEISTFSYREIQMMYAGRRIGPHYNRTEVNYGEFTANFAGRKQPQPYQAPTGWMPMRLIVKNGRMTVELSGATVYDESLPIAPDPWIAFYTSSATHGEVRHVRITGSPTIPEELSLLAQDGLQGWLATYFRENVTLGSTAAAWLLSGDELVGPQRAELAGTGKESLLKYHRPLAEDGELRYRFRYVPGQMHVHPALGQTAFILNPDGVALHQLTGGPSELTGLVATNATPVNGAGPLPLKANEDNDVTVQLRGDDLTLLLNGTTILQRPLDPRNSRIFGFFHAPGETEARISNVRYRGDWPKQLPAVDDQEFARVDPSFRTIDEAKLPAVFTHDFVANGLGKNTFSFRGDKAEAAIQATPDGARTIVVGIDGYREAGLTVRQNVVGDFDIAADFVIRRADELPATMSSGSIGIGLTVEIDSPLADSSRIGRRYRAAGDGVVDSSISFIALDGKKSYPGQQAAAAFTQGTLRAVRRGRVIHVFVRPSGEAEWKYIDTVVLGQTEHPLKSMVLVTSCLNAKDKQIETLWKSVTVRAEQLKPW